MTAPGVERSNFLKRIVVRLQGHELPVQSAVLDIVRAIRNLDDAEAIANFAGFYSQPGDRCRLACPGHYRKHSPGDRRVCDACNSLEAVEPPPGGTES